MDRNSRFGVKPDAQLAVVDGECLESKRARVVGRHCCIDSHFDRVEADGASKLKLASSRHVYVEEGCEGNLDTFCAPDGHRELDISHRNRRRSEVPVANDVRGERKRFRCRAKLCGHVYSFDVRPLLDNAKDAAGKSKLGDELDARGVEGDSSREAVESKRGRKGGKDERSVGKRKMVERLYGWYEVAEGLRSAEHKRKSNAPFSRCFILFHEYLAAEGLFV